MQRIFITGANRGIGLDLVQRYSARPDTQIFAACRQPAQATDLQALAAQYPGRIHIIQLDVTDAVQLAAAVEAVQAQADGLELLINNAGVLPGGVDNRDPDISRFGVLDAQAMLHVFAVNSISPVMVTQAFADLLRAGHAARVVNVTSNGGSIARRSEGCDYSYPASKAALNMLTRCLAGDLRPAGVIVAAIHPGFIQTDMGGTSATHTLEERIPVFMQVIDGLTLADSGTFLNWDGQPVPW